MNINGIIKKKSILIFIKILYVLVVSIYFKNLFKDYFGTVNRTPKLIAALLIGAVISLGVIYLYYLFINKYKNHKIINKKLIIIAIVSSVTILILGGNILVNFSDNITINIEATGEKNILSKSSEVWISSIVNDGEMVNLNEIHLNDGWELKEGKSLVSYHKQPNSINLTLKNSPNTKIDFVCHPWSGIVKIKNEGFEEVHDLYSSEGNSYQYIANRDDIKITKELMLAYLYPFIFLFSIVYIFLLKIYTKKELLPLVFLIPYMIYFVFNANISIDFNFRVVCFFVTFLIISILRNLQKAHNNRPINNRIKVYLFLLSLYTSFATIGSELFFKIKYVDISIANVMSIFILSIWIFPIYYIVIYMLSKLSNILNKFQNTDCIKYNECVKYVIFITIFIFGSVYLVSFKPAIMTPDSISNWGQAIGYYELMDWHPVFYTLIIRALINIYNSPIIVAIAQLLFFDFVVTSGIIYLYKKGLNIKICIIITLLVVIRPDNLINVVTIWKDIPYSISILWMTIIIAKIIDDKNYFEGKYRGIEFILALVFMSLLRHNGILVFCVTSLGLIFTKFEEKKKIASYLLIALIVVITVKGPIYNFLDVKRNSPGVKYSAMMNDIEGVVYADGDIGMQTRDFLDEIAPLETHKKMYNPFSFNDFLHGEGVKYNLLNKMEERSVGEFLQMYFDTFFRNPLLIIQNRLNGLDIMWNINQREDSYNYRYDIGMFQNDFNLKQTYNTSNNFISKLLELTYKNRLLDTINWRTGIYILFISLISIFAIYENKNKYIITLFPLLSNILSLVLSMTWQDYRYVWFIPLCTWFIVLNTLLSKKDIDDLKVEIIKKFK